MSEDSRGMTVRVQGIGGPLPSDTRNPARPSCCPTKFRQCRGEARRGGWMSVPLCAGTMPWKVQPSSRIGGLPPQRRVEARCALGAVKLPPYLGWTPSVPTGDWCAAQVSGRPREGIAWKLLARRARKTGGRGYAVGTPSARIRGVYPISREPHRSPARPHGRGPGWICSRCRRCCGMRPSR